MSFFIFLKTEGNPAALLVEIISSVASSLLELVKVNEK